ncbi:MAG: uracil phosphoribosyltransferase [Calditrichaeota bacterium]|nr:uracil phosphoribosyltransferase [Calditrichota bacterium]MCB0285809.1 uracil phosphoribosyltransferase [Calditrichota bacterium]MCB9067627.1 uracil phosphoribosyltransferase [Calditrichia bacterium]
MNHDFKNLTVVDHPLIADKLTRLRSVETPHHEFKMLLDAVSSLLFYEASRNLATQNQRIRTPLEQVEMPRLAGDVLLVPILRAGLAMVNGITPILPEVIVGMIGMYRDHDTLQPVDYYLKLPKNLDQKQVFLVDPMLATGGSASDALKKLREHGAKTITMIALIAAPEGVKRVTEAFPDVRIFAAALDRQLNEIGYILPGLGDAGDRYFGV